MTVIDISICVCISIVFFVLGGCAGQASTLDALAREEPWAIEKLEKIQNLD